MRNRSNVLPGFELTLLAPALAVGAGLLAASPSFAQQARPGEVMGLRYLTWAGKPEAPTAPSDGLRRSNAAGPPTPLAANAPRYPGIQSGSARPSRYGVGSGAGLTPASAWTGSSRTPAPAPVPLAQAPAPQEAAPRGPIPVYSAPQADPAEQARAQAAYQAQVQAQYQAWYQSEAQAQYEAQVRAMPQPQQQAVHVQAPAADQTQQPAPLQQRADAGSAPAAPADYDPMAPRRDAPIFRMQQPQAEAQSQQPAPASSTQTNAQGEVQSPVLTQPVAGRTPGGQAYAGAEPPREGVRYYSVQRAVGRQPDPIAMPESVYLDNAPIDLAEPPANPVRTRTVNGQAQVVVPNQDPNLP